MCRFCIVKEDIKDLVQMLHDLIGIQEVVEIDGYTINVESDRYDNFYNNGFTCVGCGLTATYAAIEKPDKKAKIPHINFYGTRADGKEILFTKDHIYPKSLGGFNHISNYQVMCECCNSKKKSKTDLTVEEAVKLGYTTFERAAVARQIIDKKEIILMLNNLMQEQQSKLMKLQAELGTLK